MHDAPNTDAPFVYDKLRMNYFVARVLLHHVFDSFPHGSQVRIMLSKRRRRAIITANWKRNLYARCTHGAAFTLKNFLSADKGNCETRGEHNNSHEVAWRLNFILTSSTMPICQTIFLLCCLVETLRMSSRIFFSSYTTRSPATVRFFLLYGLSLIILNCDQTRLIYLPFSFTSNVHPCLSLQIFLCSYWQIFISYIQKFLGSFL